MLSARGAATPREPHHAWLTPREPGASSAGGDVGTLKLAGRGTLTQTQPSYGQQSFRSGTDIAPCVPSGGKAGELGEGGLAKRKGLQPDIVGPMPRTPEGLSDVRLRHRQRDGPGEISVHWGLKHLPKPDPGKGYGVKTNKDEDVAQNFRAGQRLGVAEYMQSRGEAIYQSTSREPLGKSWQRGHKLPDNTVDSKFIGFGCASKTNPYSAKESVWPRGVEPESEEAKKLYCRTHGSYDPGEMTSRNYEWPNQVKENPYFRFGIADGVDTSNRGAGAKTALTMDAGDEPHGVPPTRLGKQTLAHFRDVAADHLGKPRNLLQGSARLPPGHIHGMSSNMDPINAGDLMRGFYSNEEQKPDEDLAKCTVPGRRNFLTHRSFGCPTVRNDKNAPPIHKRSVANAINYGDEVAAYNLIFPGKFQNQGVHDIDFRVRRPSEELESILAGAGHSLPPEDFTCVFENAVELHGDGEPSASLEALMHSYSLFVAAMESS